MAQLPNPFAAAGTAGSSPQGSNGGGMDALLEAMGQVVVSNHELQRTLAMQAAERDNVRPNWSRTQMFGGRELVKKSCRDGRILTGTFFNI